MSEVKLSVVIPAYNEEKNLNKGVLNQVEDYLKKVDFSFEVIIVDDGSTDQTVSLVNQRIRGRDNFRLIKNEHGGKAITVMTGLLKSSGEIALFTDMDQSTSLSEVEKFFPKFEEGFEIVVGARKGREGAPLIRRLYAWGFSLLRRAVLGFSFDTQCGFKAFSHQAVKTIFPQLLVRWEKMKAHGAAVNAGFDVEALYLARKKGLKITEVPVNWHYMGSERVGVDAATAAFKDILTIRLNDLIGKYG